MKGWQRAALLLACVAQNDLHLAFVVDGGGSAPDELVHARQQPEGNWSVSSTIHSTSLASISAPSVAVGQDGTLFVAFAVHDQFVDGCGVHVASLEPGTDEFSLRRVAEYGYDPKLAVDSNGEVHLAFCTGDGLVYAVEPD